MANFDWHSDPNTRAAPITATDRNTKNVHRCFCAELGPHFKFDHPFMASLIDGTRKTMGKAADDWLRRKCT